MEKETKAKQVESVKKIIRKNKAPVRLDIFFLFKYQFISFFYRLWVKSIFLGFRRLILLLSFLFILLYYLGVFITKI